MKTKTVQKTMVNSERDWCISQKGKKTPASISLNIESKLCFDKQKVAEYFNDYFTSIASSLVEKLPCSGRFGDAHVIDFYKNQNFQIICLV